MDNKKLEKEAKIQAHDLDGDGVVTDEEIAREKEMVELELREEKADAQQRMAWVAMGSMLVFQQSFFYLWFLTVVSMLSLIYLAFSILHRLALWVHTWVYRHG